MSIKTYKDLEVFQVSYKLALTISKTVRNYPGPEQFELARQIRRAARSIPANIVEGWAKRSSAPEFKRYLQVAIGSCDECKLWLELSKDEGYLTPQQCEELLNEFNRLGAMLKSLWRQWRSSES